MRDEDGHIRHYLDELDGANRENAWHALAEIGPVAVPAVVGALGSVGNPDVRVALIRLLAEYRAADAIPALAIQLREPLPAVWQAAVDALVAIGSGNASAALAAARSEAPEAQRGWIDEAVTQIGANRA
jgi:HEAT repeat protein